MEHNFREFKGLPIGVLDLSGDGLPLARDLATATPLKLLSDAAFDYPEFTRPAPLSKDQMKERIIMRRPQERWSDVARRSIDPNTLHGKIAGIALSEHAVPKTAAVASAFGLAAKLAPAALMSTGMASLDMVDNGPTYDQSIVAAASANEKTAATDLAIAIEQIRAGHRRGIVVIDPGHGDYMTTKKDKDGNIVLDKHGKPVMAPHPDSGTQFESGSSAGANINEDEMAEAYAASLATELTLQGFEVRFTRALDLDHNGHLNQNLFPAFQRHFLRQLNGDTPLVLSTRYDARHEVARQAQLEDPNTILVSAHIDSIDSTSTHGAFVLSHNDASAASGSATLARMTRDALRDGDQMTTRKPVEQSPDARLKLREVRAADGSLEAGLYKISAAPLSPKGLPNIPSILVEFDNRGSPKGRGCMRSPGGTNAAARAVAQAVSNFAQEHYKIQTSVHFSPSAQPLYDMPDICRTGSANPPPAMATTSFAAKVAPKKPVTEKPVVRTQVSFADKPKAPKPEPTKKKMPDQPRKAAEFAKGDKAEKGTKGRG